MTQFSDNLNGLWRNTYTAARRLAIAIVGFTVVLFGVVLIFTPGPALVVIPLGLAILATEFIWARRLLRKIKDRARTAYETLKQHRAMRRAAPPDPVC